MARAERRNPRSVPRRRQTGGGRRSTDFPLDPALLRTNLNVVLASVVETVAEGLCIVDAASRVQYVNRELERVLGLSRQEMLGRTIDELGGLSEPGWPSARAIAGSRPVYDTELTFARPDGRAVHLSVNAAPLRAEDSGVSGAVLSVRDMTDRIAAADELRRVDDSRRQLIDRLVSAQEEERRRIAADMHDDSLQVLGAIGIRLERVRRRVDEPITRAAIDDIDETVKLAATRLRHLLFNLRPPVLDREGVAAALREYLQHLRADTGLHCRLHARLEREPSLDQRSNLFRIAQEALVNIRKHARATRVDVSLDNSRGGTVLTVRDDGRGFDAGAARRADSLGLIAMSERAEMMGGWCHVTSSRKGGTQVRVWLPDATVEQSA
jgi:PAS domain S-box-containing protein